MDIGPEEDSRGQAVEVGHIGPAEEVGTETEEHIGPAEEGTARGLEAEEVRRHLYLGHTLHLAH